MSEILSQVTKGDITVINLADGTFLVCAGPVEVFEAVKFVKSEPETVKDDEPVEKEEVKTEPKKEVEEKVEPDTDEYWTPEDIEDMKKKELIELIEDEELDVDHESIASIKKLRKEVMRELGI